MTQLPLGQPLLEGHLGGQAQGPQAGGLAEIAGATMQQGAQALGLGAREQGTDTFGAMRLLAQTGQSLGGKGPQGVAYGLRGATEQGGDLRGGLAVGAGQQDLAAPQREGFPGTQASLQGLPFLGGQRANE
nr:hypothetical protein [Azotobacter chroococcum]